MKVYQRRYRYGLTPEAHAALVEVQNSACAICRTPQDSALLVVDHDHESGVVRGLLCQSCNIALGWFERPGFAEGVRRYLGAET